jgi:hypothetical protein
MMGQWSQAVDNHHEVRIVDEGSRLTGRQMAKWKQDILSQAGRFLFGSNETVRRGDQSARDQQRAKQNKSKKKKGR